MKAQKLVKRFFLLTAICFYSFSSFSQKIYADEKANYDGVSKVVVEGRFCDVTIKGQDREDVKFEGIIKGLSRKGSEYEIHHRLEGSVLKVWVESPRNSWGNIDASLQFWVPSKISVDVKNSSGDVLCENIKSDFTKLKASSGDITANRIISDLNVNTSSGEITLYEIKGNINSKSSSGNHEYRKLAGNVSSVATSGDLDMNNVVGDIVSRTSSGDVDYNMVEGKIKNVSSSGNTEITNSKVALNLTTTSGNIRGHEVLLLGDSFFKASSGDVSISLANDFEQLSFDLSASSGNLRVGNRKGDDQLYVKNGELWVHGKTSSGSQNYK